jgi:hypothetical protein
MKQESNPIFIAMDNFKLFFDWEDVLLNTILRGIKYILLVNRDLENP